MKRDETVMYQVNTSEPYGGTYAEIDSLARKAGYCGAHDFMTSHPACWELPAYVIVQGLKRESNGRTE